jgi:hypothetical protein
MLDRSVEVEQPFLVDGLGVNVMIWQIFWPKILTNMCGGDFYSNAAVNV